MAKTSETDAVRAKLNMSMSEEFDHFLAIDIELQSQIGRLRKKVGTNMAQWEAMGGDADDIREGRRLDKEGLERLKRVTRVAGYMGLVAVDSAGQWGFHAVLAPDAAPAPTTATKDGRSALARADADGWNSGWAGGTADDNPHEPGTEIYAIWAKAVLDGIASREVDKSAKAKPTPAEEPQAEAAPPATNGKGRRRKPAVATPEPASEPVPVTDDAGLLGDFEVVGMPH